MRANALSQLIIIPTTPCIQSVWEVSTAGLVPGLASAPRETRKILHTWDKRVQFNTVNFQLDFLAAKEGFNLAAVL